MRSLIPIRSRFPEEGKSLTIAVASCNVLLQAWSIPAIDSIVTLTTRQFFCLGHQNNTIWDGYDLWLHLGGFHQRWTWKAESSAQSTQSIAIAIAIAGGLYPYSTK